MESLEYLSKQTFDVYEGPAPRIPDFDVWDKQVEEHIRQTLDLDAKVPLLRDTLLGITASVTLKKIPRAMMAIAVRLWDLNQIFRNSTAKLQCRCVKCRKSSQSR